MGTFRRLNLAVCGLVAFLLAGVAVAQTGGTVKVTAVKVTPNSFSSVGDLLSTATYEGRFAASSTGPAPVAQSLFYQRKLVTPKSTVAALIRAKVKQTAPIILAEGALTLAVIGAGLFIHEITRQINADEDSPATTITATGTTVWYVYTNITNTAACYSATRAGILGCSAVWQAESPDYYGSVACVNGSGAYRYASCTGFVISINTRTVAIGSTWQREAAVTASPATDDQVVNAVKNDPAFAPYDWPDVPAWDSPLNWPTGQPKVTDPMPAQMTEVANQYRTDTGVALDPGTSDPVVAPDVLTDTTTQPSEKPGTTDQPQTSGGTSTLSFPTFCVWAATVCSAVSWFMDTPTADTAPDLPEVDVPMSSVPFDSGLGPGSCPAPVAVPLSFMGQSAGFDLSYGPMCDLAVMINPLSNVFALLVGAFILAGKRRA